MMETTMQRKIRLMSAATAAAALALACHAAGAAVLQTFGTGTAVGVATNTAHFDLNTTLANDWVEDGLLFHFSGYGANNGCGYAGVDCYDAVSDLSPAFAGNYMATSGMNAYISVRKADGGSFVRIEFAAGSGYQALNGYWATYDDGLRTGSGNFSMPRGTVLGLGDGAGFDEVRYFAFSAPNRQAGYSAPALDEVRVGLPEPASPALWAAALMGMAALRRRKRKYA
jgi:MYXO-CTERM domain-containing protein